MGQEKGSDAVTISESVGTTGEGVYDYDDPTNYFTEYVDELNPKGLRKPTPEESITLRRVLGRASYASYLICLTELAERASYYSTTNVLANFIQRPLPPGSTTGAPISSSSSQSAGALGMGITTSSAFTQLLTFLAYVVPLYGGFIADTKLGKFKAIWIGVASAFLGHLFFIIAGIPAVIATGHAIGPTALGVIFLAVGTGFIKPNLLPLLMNQYQFNQDVVKVLPSGESVIVDRQKTLERMSLLFYWAINIGAFFMLATSYAARRIGFWLAFFVPMVMYLFLPFILFYLQSRLTHETPQGSVLTNSWRILRVTFSGNFIGRWRNNTLWEYAKPSNMIARGKTVYRKGKEISWNDQWVLDIQQTIDACKIFVYFIMFNLTDGGIGNVQNAQAGAMVLNGVPNDLFNNFNPLTIIILIPILDNIIYPFLRKHHIDFKPVWRIFFGFSLSASSQIVGAIIQHFVYKTSPCGNQASTCAETSTINGWIEVIVYVLQSSGECFANVTAYELAYTRSPPQMKGLVLALFLFNSAIAAAIGEALTAALVDPLLVGTFAGTGIAGFLVAFLFLFQFRNLHVKMEKERANREALDHQTKKKDVDNSDPEKKLDIDDSHLKSDLAVIKSNV
ncbi:hypothetical protein JCM33374_g6345 [Metschnikowia sp. JCM 33374]|nr:hypothetical protein JCM33374_g6345 [Metschnikowia sp. JCM 33374]